MKTLSFKPTRPGTHSIAARKTNKAKVLTTSGMFLLALLSQANRIVRAQTIVGGSDLMTSADATKVAGWLGEGHVTFTKIFTKTPTNGKTATDFHAAADGQGRTITLYEVTNPYTGATRQIVGGYNPQSWTSNNVNNPDYWWYYGTYNITYNDSERTAFLFNLNNQTKFPQIKQSYYYDYRGQYQTYNSAYYGPTFGGGHDIYVASDLTSSYFNGYSYSPDGSTNTYQNILGGSYDWNTTIGTLEVFTISAAPVNTPPVVDSAVINESAPKTNDTLSLTATSHDADNDAIAYSYQWLKNGDVIAGATGNTLDLSVEGNGNKGDKISVRVVANAGGANSQAVTSDEVTIADTAPVVNSAAINESAPKTNDTLSLTVASSDDDNDAITYSYQWLKNGDVITGATNATLDLTTAGNKGDKISVQVVATAGGASSPTVTSAEVTVANTAPTAANDAKTTTSVTPVTGDVQISDADGEALTAAVVSGPTNGELEFNADGTYVYTPAVGFTGTDTFTYKANDGTANSNVATITITVTQPSTTAGSKVTGGGLVTGKIGGRANFNINVQSAADGSIKGKIDYSDSPSGTFIRSTTITSLVVSTTGTRILGKATLNGAGSYDFVIDVVDNGEPGDSDTYRIRLSNGYANGPKALDGGNIQVHK